VILKTNSNHYLLTTKIAVQLFNKYTQLMVDKG